MRCDPISRTCSFAAAAGGGVPALAARLPRAVTCAGGVASAGGVCAGGGCAVRGHYPAPQRSRALACALSRPHALPASNASLS